MRSCDRPDARLTPALARNGTLNLGPIPLEVNSTDYGAVAVRVLDAWKATPRLYSVSGLPPGTHPSEYAKQLTKAYKLPENAILEAVNYDHTSRVLTSLRPDAPPLPEKVDVGSQPDHSQHSAYTLRAEAVQPERLDTMIHRVPPPSQRVQAADRSARSKEADMALQRAYTLLHLQDAAQARTAAEGQTVGPQQELPTDPRPAAAAAAAATAASAAAAAAAPGQAGAAGQARPPAPRPTAAAAATTVDPPKPTQQQRDPNRATAAELQAALMREAEDRAVRAQRLIDGPARAAERRVQDDANRREARQRQEAEEAAAEAAAAAAGERQAERQREAAEAARAAAAANASDDAPPADPAIAAAPVQATEDQTARAVNPAPEQQQQEEQTAEPANAGTQATQQPPEVVHAATAAPPPAGQQQLQQRLKTPTASRKKPRSSQLTPGAGDSRATGPAATGTPATTDPFGPSAIARGERGRQRSPSAVSPEEATPRKRRSRSRGKAIADMTREEVLAWGEDVRGGGWARFEGESDDAFIARVKARSAGGKGPTGDAMRARSADTRKTATVANTPSSAARPVRTRSRSVSQRSDASTPAASQLAHSLELRLSQASQDGANTYTDPTLQAPAAATPPAPQQ